MIPVHNGAPLVAEALASVLDADLPSDTQVEVVDDRSTDDTAAIVEGLADRGVTHHVNSRQLGAPENFNECIRRARGQFVHILHADDAVHRGFYPAMDRGFESTSVVSAVCRARYVDEDGVPFTVTPSLQATGLWHEARRDLAITIPVRTPAIVVRRRAYEEIGGFHRGLGHAADWHLMARLAAHGRIWYDDRVLVDYRKHQGADTNSWVRSGHNMIERADVLDAVVPLLHPHAVRSHMRRALGYSARFALSNAVRLARSGDMAAAGNQVRATAGSLAGIVSGSTDPIRRLVPDERVGS